MEATATASLGRILASSPLPCGSCHSCVRVAVAPEQRRRGRAVLAAEASTGKYMLPLDATPSGITRPLVEILRDLNKRVLETIVLPASRRASASDPIIPWYLSPPLCSDSPSPCHASSRPVDEFEVSLMLTLLIQKGLNLIP
ncbi:uncharacterized protein LOC119280143 [Triticum dicoccoides]|uniref:uncharacterized protein LOC119280143 n=1 Tax=Triticum dicoccoides TaxID=85692 RepID=UPI00188F07C1|nr:uncharacterized protein LOC119280143 [Triticum dicoccoides]